MQTEDAQTKKIDIKQKNCLKMQILDHLLSSSNGSVSLSSGQSRKDGRRAQTGSQEEGMGKEGGGEEAGGG